MLYGRLNVPLKSMICIKISKLIHLRNEMWLNTFAE